MIYIASCYSHPNHLVRQHRYEQVCRFCAKLISEGKVVLSPIAMNHGIATLADMPLGWDFWAKADRELLAACSEVIVITGDGWKESVGIAAELAIAEEMGLPISYADPEME